MAGTWTGLVNQPNFNAGSMFLMTNGTVLCNQFDNAGNYGTRKWWKLTPDNFGSYINGTWSPIADSINARTFFSSAVLRDGRLLVIGGEYSDTSGTMQQDETNKAEIYDPVTNTWKSLTPPAGWTGVGDGACCLLPDGRFLLGYYNGTKTAIYDPVSNTWSAGATKLDSASEETWVLLSDGTIVSPQCTNHPNAEKYLIGANKWVSAGTIPVDLVEAASIETGAGVLLPDGRAFFIGATGKTALYTKPANPANPGTWTAGPTFPKINNKQLGGKDSPACLLPNGKVLCAVGPVDGVSGDFLSPTYFFEFDGVSLTQVTSPGNSGNIPYQGRMMLVPSGEVLFAAQPSNKIFAYTADSKPQDAWRPQIVSVTGIGYAGSTYTLTGRQLNGLSQAVGYGDDYSAATNYPLVRLKNKTTSVVYFCKTKNFSTMGVATGSALVTTDFTIPLNVPEGMYELCVVANGIFSATCSCIYIYHYRIVWPPKLYYEIFAELIGSLADGPLWVLTPHGPEPVDPWGPFYEKRVQDAVSQIRNGFREWQAIGNEIAELQAKQGFNGIGNINTKAGKAKATAKKKATRKKK